MMSKLSLQGILHTTALMLFWMWLFISPSIAVHAQNIPQAHVLVLNSYGKGFPWTDNIVKGVESVLSKESVDLKVEYMDSKAVKYDSAYKKKLYDLYAHKYKDQKFNVVLTTDDNALNFVREYHEEIFPGSSVVFAGVNNTEIPDLVNRKIFTGILETTAEKETLDLILNLHPGTKRLALIFDTTPSGNYRWKQLEKIFPYYPEIELVRFDDSYNISEIEDKLRNLTDDTVAIFATLYRDKSGRFISLEEGASRISKASKQPIYTFHLHILEYGTIGGKLLGGKHHGKLAAEMALQIIQGEKSPQNIPIATQTLAEYIFDYSQLKRFNIQASALPKESIILNRPTSLYEDYKTLFWFVILFIFMLIMVILTIQLNIIKLRRSEERSRNLFDNAEISIWNEDFSEVYKALDKLRRDGVSDLRRYLDENEQAARVMAGMVKVSQVNEATLNMFGAKAAEQFFDQIDNTFGANAIEVFIDELCAIWDKRKVFRTEAALWTLDGKELQTIITFRIPGTEDGFKSIPVSIIDITARKRAEEAAESAHTKTEGLLAESNQSRCVLLSIMEDQKNTEEELKRSETQLRKLAQAVEQSQESIVITNLNAEIEYVNDAFVTTTGYSREEVIGQNPRILNSGKTPPETYVAMWDTLVHGQSWKGEFFNKRKDGTEYIEFARITPIQQPDGSVSHYVAVKQDITERKRMEEELVAYRERLEALVEERTGELIVARDRAEESDRLKSTFLAVMSHELRTPLNSIIGFTGIIMQGLAGPLTEEQTKQLGMVQGSAHHLLELINDVLDISKIEAGEIEVTPKLFDVGEAIDKTVQKVMPLAKKKGVALAVDVADEVGSITSDRRRFEQILINLANNAVKFSEQGEVRIECYLSEERLVTRVKDTGIGIKPEDMDKLFKEFRQIETDLNRKQEGTGLGLSICKKLVSVLGGDIWAESKPGEGSVFSFSLPVKTGE